MGATGNGGASGSRGIERTSGRGKRADGGASGRADGGSERTGEAGGRRRQRPPAWANDLRIPPATEPWPGAGPRTALAVAVLLAAAALVTGRWLLHGETTARPTRCRGNRRSCAEDGGNGRAAAAREDETTAGDAWTGASAGDGMPTTRPTAVRRSTTRRTAARRSPTRPRRRRTRRRSSGEPTSAEVSAGDVPARPEGIAVGSAGTHRRGPRSLLSRMRARRRLRTSHPRRRSKRRRRPARRRRRPSPPRPRFAGGWSGRRASCAGAACSWRICRAGCGRELRGWMRPWRPGGRRKRGDARRTPAAAGGGGGRRAVRASEVGAGRGGAGGGGERRAGRRRPGELAAPAPRSTAGRYDSTNRKLNDILGGCGRAGRRMEPLTIARMAWIRKGSHAGPSPEVGLRGIYRPLDATLCPATAPCRQSWKRRSTAGCFGS